MISRPFAISAMASLLLASCAPSATPTLPTRTVTTRATRQQVGAPPVQGGCRVFPTDNPWNTDISNAAVDPNSATYLQHMNAGTSFLHVNAGDIPGFGIPYVIVPPGQPFVPITFNIYPKTSDPGPYPVPATAPIEGGPNATGDRHVLVLDSGNCHLYEMWKSYYVGPGWLAGCGAIFDLSSDKLRPDGWTSADEAGLPIFAGLVKYDEANSGAIEHAFRFTMQKTQRAYIHPATHAGGTIRDPAYPPMGLRVRLKASYDISHFTGAAHTILFALQHYGMFLADNGHDWNISGAPDPRWDTSNLKTLMKVPASAFEVVQTGPVHPY